MLAQFSSVDEVKAAFPAIRVIGIDEPGTTSSVHWRIGDSTGKQVVLEIVNGIPHFYDCIDLKNIDFNTVSYHSFPLDQTRQEPIEYLHIE